MRRLVVLIAFAVASMSVLACGSPPPVDVMNPLGCTPETPSGGPEVVELSAMPTDIWAGGTGSVSIRFRSPCGIQSTLSTPDGRRVFNTGPVSIEHEGPCIGPPPVETRALLRTTGLPSWVAVANCTMQAGNLQATDADLVDGTWVDGTITIDFEVEVCLPGATIKWSVYLIDATPTATWFDMDRMPAEFPEALLHCVVPPV